MDHVVGFLVFVGLRLVAAVSFLWPFSHDSSCPALQPQISINPTTLPVCTIILGRSGASPWHLHGTKNTSTSPRGRLVSRAGRLIVIGDRHNQAPFCDRVVANALMLCLERAVDYAEVVQGRPDLGLDKAVNVDQDPGRRPPRRPRWPEQE